MNLIFSSTIIKKRKRLIIFEKRKSVNVNINWKLRMDF